jgi:hypothetical protein
MVIDYKGVSFSFKKIKREKRLKRLRLIGIVVVIIILFLIAANEIDSGKVKTIQTLLLDSNITDASDRLKNIGSALFHKNTKKELKALLYLFLNEVTRARLILEELGPKSTLIDHWKFVNYFSDRAEYRKLDIYTDYLIKKKEKIKKGEELLFYNAMTKTGLLAPRQSARVLDQLSPGLKKENEKALALISKTNDRLQSGKINYIFDNNGMPLAYYDIEKKKTISLTPGISFDAFTNEIQTSFKFYHLTLDKRFQEKIHRLFRNFNGSFLLMNVNDSSIAAAYSKPVDPSKRDMNTVFSEGYEPGSIIKLLTLFAYLQSPQPDLFPIRCEGLWRINDDIFYDWTVHHRVENSQEALVVSCNIAFAKMGIGVGYAALSEIFNRFYFNRESKGFADLFLIFNTGTYKRDISSSSLYRIANLSEGLNEISITTFHSALISAVISQNGSIYRPYLIKNKKNLLNIAFYNHTGQLIEVFKAGTTFLKLRNAMKLVVEAPHGTGKRARVDFTKVALKTGTAGNKKLGLDAILTGFFPADKPQYAFAFRLERVGKAEWRGALFLKDFLIAFYHDNPRQQGVK